ncbi:unnamed protein product [Schistocephalus solidus]|uniref:Uncharacterized protein n=1 Tax=Schistocephalus solidus TaxID=70667 RepID=A0A183SRV7_SCHSO|nr:unnamed protein product [Schistocephalus solidus]
MEPHLGDEKVVIRQSIGIGDRLCHQHVLFISPPDENIVQEVPVSRTRMYPGRFLPLWEAEEGVGQNKAVFSAGSQENKAVVIEAKKTMGTQHTSPRGTVCADVGIEVTKDN